MPARSVPGWESFSSRRSNLLGFAPTAPIKRKYFPKKDASKSFYTLVLSLTIHKTPTGVSECLHLLATLSLHFYYYQSSHRGLGFGVWGLGFGVWEIGRA